MKCPKCNTNNPDDSKNCKECAASLTGAVEVQPAFTKTLATPVEEPTRGTLFAEGIARLYEQTDRKGKAIEHYEKFLDLWKGAETLRFYISMGFEVVKRGRLRENMGYKWRHSTLRKKLTA